MFIRVHFVGWLCYTILSVAFAFMILNFIGNSLKCSELTFILFLGSFGTTFGALWNLLGYQGDMRVKWSHLIKGFQSIHPDNMAMIKIRKSKSLTKHIAWYITMAIISLTCAVIVVINLHQDFFTTKNYGEYVSANLNIYYTFIAMFIAVFVLYSREIFSHFYMKKQDGSLNIYFNIDDLD